MKSSKSKTTKKTRKPAYDLKALYARYRRQFSAADLQKYTEVLEGVPLSETIAKMELKKSAAKGNAG